ncbi:MAG TPA: DUF1727 domain-containing protein [Clostridiaceae bacterium]|nr:DUF1727 domain-containing protein [Clostridiaceae bacterium]
MSLRNKFAVAMGRLTRTILRALGRQASTLPGRVTLTLASDTLAYMAQNRRIVCVTGTNGKTTSTSLLTDVLTGLGVRVTTNRSGANMQMGLMTTLMSSDPGEVSVLEVDEAAFAKCAVDLNPTAVLVTNIFPDQMDRYGSIAAIRNLIKDGCAKTRATLILCGDDPNVVAIGEQVENTCIYYGADPDTHDPLPHSLNRIAGTGEEYHCPYCNHLLNYKSQVMRQQGDFSCPNCFFRHPKLDFSFKIETGGQLSVAATQAGVQAKGLLPIEGYFNAFNACGVAAVAKTLYETVSLSDVVDQFKKAKPQYGRLERIPYSDKELCFVLIKNAAGMEQGVRLVTEMDDIGGILFVINNRPADGEDVTWIWDTELENMTLPAVPYGASGSCRSAVAERLEAVFSPHQHVTIEADAVKLTLEMLDTCPPGKCLYVLPNYTAMLELRERLAEPLHFSKQWGE